MLRSRMLRPFRDGRVLFAVPPYANAGAPDGPRFPKGLSLDWATAWRDPSIPEFLLTA